MIFGYAPTYRQTTNDDNEGFHVIQCDMCTDGVVYGVVYGVVSGSVPRLVSLPRANLP
jgi:hypothetical protein